MGPVAIKKMDERDRRQAEKVDKNPQYFPSTFNSFERVWYHSQLAACGEPSLYVDRNKEITAYRFSWIPTFNHTICARLTLHPDGTGELKLEQLSGAGGYQPGHIAYSGTFPVTKEQVESVKTLLSQMNFWGRDDGIMNRDSGTDGSQWLLEGVQDHKYRIVEMWTPSSGPLVDLVRLFVNSFAHLTGKDVLSY